MDVWVSTLRREGRPSATQDLLPAAGPALPGGIGYPQGSDKRFHIEMILLFRASCAMSGFPLAFLWLSRGQEFEELRARLASLTDQHADLRAQHQSAESLLANVQARNNELTAEGEQLACRYREKLESEQIEREKLAGEVAGLCAGLEGLAAASGRSPSDGPTVQVAPSATPDSTGLRPTGRMQAGILRHRTICVA